MKVLANGGEIPFQQTADGNVLVRVEGGIAANSTTTWKVKPHAATPAFTDQAWVTDTGTNYELDNGIIAVRVPKVIACTPATWSEIEEYTATERYYLNTYPIYAPIQGFRHCDGTWTGTGPNYLKTWQAYENGVGFGDFDYPATEPPLIEIVENGPLRAQVRVTYTALRPSYWVNVPPPAWCQWHEEGYFICTITLDAGQNTVHVQNETDGRINWFVDMNIGVDANRARFKGTSSSSIEDGHNYDGTIVAAGNTHLEMECNLHEAGTRTGYTWTGATAMDCVVYPVMWRWSDYSQDTGVYWYCYNSTDDATGNVWGITHGRPSTAIKELFQGVYGAPATGIPTEVGFWLFAGTILLGEAESADNIHDFTIYLGTKADVPVDFSAATYWSSIYGSPDFDNANAFPTYPSGMARAFNYSTGTAQAWKQMYQSLEYPDPSGGWPGIHLSRADTEAIITDLEADQGAGSYYEFLWNNDTIYREVWDAFADDTNTLAIAMAADMNDWMTIAIETYVNKGGLQSPGWGFWVGGLTFQMMSTKIMALISLDQVRPFLSAAEKRKLKGILAAIGHITWDNDFVPLDNNTYGLFNFGTINTTVQYEQQRNQFAAQLSTHPAFVARSETLLDRSVILLNNVTTPEGAVFNCPNYSGAMTVPVFDIWRQLQIGGFGDLFATTSPGYARMVGYCEWLLQMTTPPQSRFKLDGVPMRKFVCYGDGSSQGHDNQLTLIMGLKPHNLTLSKRLAWLWYAMGKRLVSFYNCSGLKVQMAALETQDPALGDADFPGHTTMFRSAWGTADESAVFVSHGSANIDHSLYQRGSPCIYLLGEPICISFGLHTPKPNGPWVSASTYIPVSELDSDGAYPSLVWNTYTDINTLCGEHSGLFDDTYTCDLGEMRCDLECAFIVPDNWTRHVTFYKDDTAMPVVRFRDDNSASGDSILTLHLMATGSYKQPNGSTVAAPTTLNGTTYAITNGQHFEFTGQEGVHFDVYYFGPSANAFVGMYKHNTHPGPEMAQYSAAHSGAGFEEKQYILRIKTAGPCDTVIVPYRSRPAGLLVTQVVSGEPALNLFTTAGGNRSLPS